MGTSTPAGSTACLSYGYGLKCTLFATGRHPTEHVPSGAIGGAAMSADDERAVRAMFTFLAPGLRRLADRFSDDGAAAFDEAAATFDAMIPGLAYLDDPSHPMAMSSFFCSANLAMYLALRDRGVDVHEFGRAVVEDFAPALVRTSRPTSRSRRSWRSSEPPPTRLGRCAPGEFVFEVVGGDADSDWGMNVTSSAICAQFSKYDAHGARAVHVLARRRHEHAGRGSGALARSPSAPPTATSATSRAVCPCTWPTSTRTASACTARGLDPRSYSCHTAGTN